MVALTRQPRTLYLTSFVLVGLSIVALGPALTELRERSGSDIGTIGVLFSAQAIGYIIGSFGAGHLLDRIPGHRALAGSLTLLGLGLASVPSLESLESLVVGFIVIGVGASGVDVGGNTLLMWERGAAVGRSMNMLHLAFGLGALIAPVFVRVSLDLTTRVAGVAAIALAVWALRIPSPRFIGGPDRDHTTTRTPALVWGTLFFILYVGLEVGFSGWITTYGEEVDFSTTTATWLTTSFWFAFILGRFIAMISANRVLPKHVIVGSTCLVVVGAAILLVGHGAVAAVWTGTLILGLGLAPQFPAMMTYLERRFAVTGRATSLFVAGAGVGQLIFPWLIGQWFDVSGAIAVPWSTLFLAAATLAVFVVLVRSAGARPPR